MINKIILYFNLFLSSLIFLGYSKLIFLAPCAEAMIIDHHCTDISKIPDQWINIVKTMTLHHTGQSHGRQVPHGFANIESANSKYAQTQSENGIPSGPGLKITRGQRSEYNSWLSSIGPERYWQGNEGRAWTRRTLNYHASNGNTIHASLHTWCWHMRTWSESQVDEYLSSMEILEAEYPNTTFIYMTDTCDKEGSSGYNRWLRNEQIRQYCRENNKVLFDFGELESWSADRTKQNTYSYNGQNIPYWHDDWTKGAYYNDGHINEAACTMKAKAMWWLLARIAGWNPNGVTGQDYVGSGDFNGDGKADIVRFYDGDITIYLMDGVSVIQNGVVASQLSSNWQIKAINDFSNDGNDDILLRNKDSGKIVIWLIEGTSISDGGSPETPSLVWTIKSIADFNNDGNADILLRNTNSGKLLIWLMEGYSISDGGFPETPSLVWTIKSVADFNNDGNADILLRNTNSGKLLIWLMEGYSISDGGFPETPSLVWTIKSVADFNNDGNADILLRNSNSGKLLIWLMEGYSISDGGLAG